VSQILSKAFGRAVRQHRERMGISQEDLAARSDIHRTYVSSVELGKVRLGLEIAKKLAVGLGIPLHLLIKDAEKEEGSS
jgi:transcriptional regulator with XRE-family HTH domain